MKVALKLDAPTASGPVGERMRFALHGVERPYDRRITPHRGDLADISLAGELFAPHYAEPVLMRCADAHVPLFAGYDERSEAMSELLMGEDFAMLDKTGDVAWGYCLADNYVGYVRASALWHPQELPVPTHQVVARSTVLLAEPEVKAPIHQQLPMGAKLAAAGTMADGKYLESAQGFVPLQHVSAIGAASEDIAALAERLHGAPYVWGGRSGHGLDCSGLVQLVLGLHGLAAPRDSDQQQLVLGRTLNAGETLQRNDLVFFPGHVGIMVDGENMVHANSAWMAVSTEPLADAVARFEDDNPILACRRLDG